MEKGTAVAQQATQTQIETLKAWVLGSQLTRKWVVIELLRATERLTKSVRVCLRFSESAAIPSEVTTLSETIRKLNFELEKMNLSGRLFWICEPNIFIFWFSPTGDADYRHVECEVGDWDGKKIGVNAHIRYPNGSKVPVICLGLISNSRVCFR